MQNQRNKSNIPYIPLLVFALSCILSGCISSNSDGIRSAKIAADPSILRVGVSANAPPLVYKRNGKLTGLEVDLARKLGRFTGRQVKFIEVDWDKQIDALVNNETDIIMSGMSITPARQYRIAFSTPYLRSGQILLVRLQEKGLFSTGIYSLMNSSYTIGTVEDTTGDLFVTTNISRAKIKRFKKSEDAVNALINKDIDAFVYDAPMICYYSAVNENTKLTPILSLATEEFNAWGIRKDDTKLLVQANQFLQQLKDEHRLHEIIRTWIPYM